MEAKTMLTLGLTLQIGNGTRRQQNPSYEMTLSCDFVVISYM